MLPKTNYMIELETFAIRKYNVLAIAKGVQPATMMGTTDIPYMQITLQNASPLVIPYETADERDRDYNIILEALNG